MRDARSIARAPTVAGIRPGSLWLILVGVLFCLPLFVGLGRTDIQGDEAIYSFGTDVMVASGDWLTPKSSPWESAPFLEKPPLKFWIVAAPIALGLLPDNEFGLRFWDAVFGSLAFLYVFAIGRRIGGIVCGLTAVLMLFVHRPLLFEHGLRSNNMEASLVLAYCGGVYHFVMWRTSDQGVRGLLHLFAVAGFFVLAFMTKFVAALFLPVIMAVILVSSPDDRSRFAQYWRVWFAASALATVLIVPWFVYEYIRYGSVFVEDVFGSAVYTRFTTFLDPTHVQPWHFYISTMWNELAASQVLLWTVGGLVLIVWRTVRTGWLDGATILLWLALPIGLISFGSSKLYHYAYPFLPPLALAAGYMVSVALKAVVSLFSWLSRWVDRRMPAAARRVLDRPGVRRVLMVVAAASGLIVICILVFGPIKIAPWGPVLLRASSPYRLLAVVILAVLLSRRAGALTLTVAVLVIASMLPLDAYRRDFSQLTVERHPVRSMRDCIQRVGASRATSDDRPPVYVEGGNVSHAVAFYMRTLGRWTPESPSDANIATSLFERPRPVLLAPARFRALEVAWSKSSRLADVLAVPLIDQLLLLPGPFGVCAVEHQRTQRR